MRCKIVRFQKLMLRNMMRLTKSQKASILYYSINIDINMKQCHIEIGSYGIRVYCTINI